jgi:hypothetical protein
MRRGSIGTIVVQARTAIHSARYRIDFHFRDILQDAVLRAALIAARSSFA